MSDPFDPGAGEADAARERRLFLEDLCCQLLRPPAGREAHLRREVFLGPGSFADGVLLAPGQRPCLLEVKHGYGREKMLAHLARKYGPGSAGFPDADRLIVVIEGSDPAEAEASAAAIAGAVRPGLSVEVWNEAKLAALIRDRFGAELAGGGAEVTAVREAVERAQGKRAFGDAFTFDPQQAALLWHLDYDRLHDLRGGKRGPRELLTPGLYRGVAVIFADLSSFSSYVRDTRDDALVRHVLTSFYAKSRYQILDEGGMLYQFLGDGVVALFGIPATWPGHLEAAARCARGLLDIGASVMNEWQRHIDQRQSSAACHIGMALGDVSVVPLRPYSRTHLGAIAEAINVASRLCSAAAADQIVAANSLYQRLSPEAREGFVEAETVQARNVGALQAWRWSARRG